ncbi:MAG: glycosyltransferase family 2 protein [Gemmatimonadetes bacterium]|nr:glycosyltransferase family 2 protein [Gemmatimonadota bacterium]
MGFNALVLLYFAAINGVYLMTTSLALATVRRYARQLRLLDLLDPSRSRAAPPITIVAPAFNEEATCVESTRSLLWLDYPRHHIIVVNDGSSDATLDRLTTSFDLVPASRMPTSELPTAPVRRIYQSRNHPNLWVIDKSNGGKADALNAGINYCATPFFCAVDADTVLDRDALTRIVRPFLEDRRTVAAGGLIRVVNDCDVRSGIVERVRLPRNMLARLQVVEYLRAFLVGRIGWARMNASMVIAGAFGLFSRTAVVDAGGYASRHTTGETVGEDMELVVRMKRVGAERGVDFRLAFVPDSVAWTEVPESLSVLSRQRERWQRGLYESLTRHRTMLFRPAYGATGMVSFPHFFLLEMMGPVVETLGYLAFGATVAMGLASPGYVLAFFTLSVLLGVVMSLSAVVLEELAFGRYSSRRDLLWLFALAVLENLGYRQLNMVWRLKGLVRAIRGAQGWGRMERRGFSGSVPSAGKQPAEAR